MNPYYGSNYGGPQAYGYGGYGGGAAAGYATQYDDGMLDDEQFAKAKPGRRRLNVVGVLAGLLIPWTLFCVLQCMMSFWLHYKFPLLVYLIMVLVLVGILANLAKAVTAMRNRLSHGGNAEPHWQVFIFSCCLVFFFLAAGLGYWNFEKYMQPFYDIEGLRVRGAIDPATFSGQELMDAGRVEFVQGSRVDTTKAMGFKNSQTYCVAPVGKLVPGTTTGAMTPLNAYDFWVVGIDCCSGEAGDFGTCVPPNAIDGRYGLRYMIDAPRAFFRLAIQQAEAKFQIKANHPLFFSWVQNPQDGLSHMQAAAFRNVLWAMIGTFLLQCIITTVASVSFAKQGLVH